MRDCSPAFAVVAGDRGLSGELQRGADRYRMFRFVFDLFLVESKTLLSDGPKATFVCLRQFTCCVCCMSRDVRDCSPNDDHWFCCLVVGPVCGLLESRCLSEQRSLADELEEQRRFIYLSIICLPLCGVWRLVGMLVILWLLLILLDCLLRVG